VKVQEEVGIIVVGVRVVIRIVVRIRRIVHGVGRDPPHVYESDGQIWEDVLNIVNCLDLCSDDLPDDRDAAIEQDGRIPACRVDQQETALR